MLVTTTSTVPAASGGAYAVIDVSELTVKLGALMPPNITPEAVVKPVPVMVTGLPPPEGPNDGLMALTVGTATSLDAFAVNTAPENSEVVPLGAVPVAVAVT
jgi:hypothetical protein